MKYKVYFEIFGKKLVKEVEANSPYAAICKIENEKPKIIKTVEKDPLEDLTEDNAFEKLKEMFGL
jgi:hypothetical protein